ncbi:MAG: Rne/Rng family ribonuclease, partial [Rhodospirillaceae bacterium]|nr:Rne/Rng family ribonuclease [Rhodospirillaceae bacterium]
MTKDILISMRPGRASTAVVEGGRLVELIVDDANSGSLVGNIYLGRVEKVLDQLAAAFVDIGLGKSGFLGLAEARPINAERNGDDSISDYLVEGDKVVVQVQRDGFEDKGAKLTTRLALTGRILVMTPGDEGLRISRRIDDADTRGRLDSLIGGLKTEDEGFIVRTAAAGATDEEITGDIENLRQSGLAMEAARDTQTPPALLLGEQDPTLRALRDLAGDNVARIVIDSADALASAKSWCAASAPALADKLSHHNAAKPLFEAEGIEDDIDSALGPEVALPSGGSVIFGETPALVAIDVNSGGTFRSGAEQSALAANMEAVGEIARQIRLRNLSGLLVVDFISMKKAESNDKVLGAMKKAVSGDSMSVFVGGFTRFGLLEMTRRRGREALSKLLTRSCEMCEGIGYTRSPLTASLTALDRLFAENDSDPSMRLSLLVSPELADALDGEALAALRAVEERLGRTIKITV